MKSLDRVRKAFGMYTSAYTERGEERVDDLFDSVENEVKERYIELPTDADGFPIHVGDEMDCGEHFGVQEVEGFIHGAVAFTVCDPQPARICTCPAHMTRHYHKPTVEDVLRDFAIACEDAGNAGDAVERLISEYAEKLQLKEESGE